MKTKKNTGKKKIQKEKRNFFDTALEHSELSCEVNRRAVQDELDRVNFTGIVLGWLAGWLLY